MPQTIFFFVLTALKITSTKFLISAVNYFWNRKTKILFLSKNKWTHFFVF